MHRFGDLVGRKSTYRNNVFFGTGLLRESQYLQLLKKTLSKKTRLLFLSKNTNCRGLVARPCAQASTATMAKALCPSKHPRREEPRPGWAQKDTDMEFNYLY